MTSAAETATKQSAATDPRTNADHTARPSQDSRLGSEYYYVERGRR